MGSNSGYYSVPWGAGDLNSNGFSDFFAFEDYDGDGKTDFAVWRRPIQPNQQAYFYILYSATNTFDAIAWGVSASSQVGTDEPVPQDYDGDGKADVAIRRANGQGLFWWILQSRDGLRVERFGLSGDVPTRGDYDGDGKADLGVARRSDQTANSVYNFSIKYSSDGSVKTATLGVFVSDLLAPGDYDGDGKTDIAVWRGRSIEFSSGGWFWIRSSDGRRVSLRWGFSRPTDYPAQGDYDGDGITDAAIYRPSGSCTTPSYFWINGSSSGVQIIPFGNCHGVPEIYF